MKIWVIGRNYPNKKNKMCGSFEVEQAKMLAKNGHEVSYLVCVFHPLYKVKKWGSAEWKEDINVYAYSQLYAPQRLNFYWDNFKEKKWLKLLRYVEEKEGIPDIIHVHYPTMITVPQVILDYQKKGTKIIATEHWTKVQSGKLNKHELNQLMMYATQGNQFVCVGEALRDQVKVLTGADENLHVIPNIVSENFQIASRKHRGFRFVAVGRLVEVKQFDKIIEAFNKKFKGIDGVSLTIIGGGSQYEKLKQQIKKFGLDKQVALTGVLSRQEIANRVSNSDVLVCFSRLETFGVPIIEAWYCGIPTIGTNAIGFKSNWKSELGELISYDDVDLLAESMVTMQEQYGKYSKQFIKEYAASLFSERAVYKKLYELYCKD